MDLNILTARGTNRLLGILIGIQLIVLLAIGVLLIEPMANGILSLTTIISSLLTVLISIPLSLFLYLSTTEKTLKRISLSISLALVLTTVSGILWEVVPAVTGSNITIPVAKILMALSYVPILLLVSLLRSTGRDIGRHLKVSILFINVVSVFVLLSLVAINLLDRGGNIFDVSLYTYALIADILIVSLCSLLALNYMQNQYRYVFLVLVVYFLLAMAGDMFNLLSTMGLYDSHIYSHFFYDMMFVLITAALLYFSFNSIKVTTVEEVNKELRDTKSLMSDLIMQSPDAICIFNTEGDAVLANHAFIRLNGEQPSSVLGKLNIFRDADQFVDGAAARMALVRDGGLLTFDGIKTMQTGDGATRYYQVKAFPTYGSDGRITSYIVMMTDVTDYKSYEEELVRARAQAELYLDLMGHDINNMNQIGIGFLEMALERLDLDNAGQMLIRKPLEAMHNSSHLIDNVKKIQRASASAPGLVPVDLGKVLEGAVGEYSHLPGRDSLIEYLPVHGCYVSANQLLKDVFTNLIGNAFKHSEGPLKVWISVSSLLQGGIKYYRVSVEDNGPGIPENIRQMFQDRVYPVKTRTGGSGLGLYLVKMLVGSFKGTITVEDRVPGDRKAGSRVIVLLPAADADDSPDAATSTCHV